MSKLQTIASHCKLLKSSPLVHFERRLVGEVALLSRYGRNRRLCESETAVEGNERSPLGAPKIISGNYLASCTWPPGAAIK
jgi:hypothetical protein